MFINWHKIKKKKLLKVQTIKYGWELEKIAKTTKFLSINTKKEK